MLHYRRRKLTNDFFGRTSATMVGCYVDILIYEANRKIKVYTPEKLVAISRYQNYFPTLPQEIREDVYGRMEQLLSEENEYCDKETIIIWRDPDINRAL